MPRRHLHSRFDRSADDREPAPGWRSPRARDGKSFRCTRKSFRALSARGRRPAYDRMLKDATRRRFEVLLAWDVSRLGRSLRELLDCFETLRRTGVDLYLDQQGVDTTTPAGRALFGMAGVFAEFERSMLIERTGPG